MESIYSLLSTLFDFTLAGGALFFIVKMLQFHQRRAAKNDLQKLQARVSMLRISLKSKVKKRANSFRVFFTKNIVPGDAIDLEFDRMVENKFESSADFQNYFDLVKQVHAQLLQIHSKTEILVRNFIPSDQQNELAIVKIVIEMKDISLKFNIKADSFNRMHPKSRIGHLDPMSFSASDDFEQILKDEAINDEAIVNEDHFDAA